MSAGGIDLEVCMRSLAPESVQERQREVLDRVEALAAAGTVGSVTVTWWSDKVCPPDADTPLADSCPTVVRELLALAEREGISLAPYFSAHARVGHGTEDSLVLPVIALVLRRDGEIRGVYPIERGDRRYTVEDCLHGLEDGESVTNLPSG